MGQIPELLFMTNTVETADRNGVYTLNFKLYIEISLLHVGTKWMQRKTTP